MGRLRALPLMISLCLLTACGGGAEEGGEALALRLQKEFSAMTSCSCRVELEADYGERVFDCALDVTYDQVTGGTLTLVEPELARGVTARVADDGVSLSYQGFSLDTGDLTEDGLSPVEAVPRFYQMMTKGFLARVDQTGQTLSVTYRDGNQTPGVGLEAVVTFDVDRHAPLTGELFWNGRRVISAKVSDFQMIATPDQIVADEG